jgi:predicted Zn-dependent protease with MMP-like domain
MAAATWFLSDPCHRHGSRLLGIRGSKMRPELRSYFDRKLEEVLQGLPDQVHHLLQEVPLLVDDQPTAEQQRALGVSADGLCGLYTGVPRIHRSIEHSGLPGDVIQIFRRGILGMAHDGRGGIDEAELARQIRLTILHELGHHFGMDEEELEELGY